MVSNFIFVRINSEAMINSEQLNLEYSNSYGLIFEDRFYVQRENDLSCINLNKVKKIKLVKGRTFKINFITFFISCLIICFSLLLEQNQMIFKDLFYLGGLAFFLSSFFLKKYNYTIIVVTIDYQPIKISVDVDFKNDAKEIVDKVNKKLTRKEIQ